MDRQENKKIAVTGATGMLGSHLVAELLCRGYSDIVLPVRNLKRLSRLWDRLDDDGIEYRKENFTVIEVELNNPIELAQAFKAVDTVYHTAAIVDFSDSKPDELIETNVEMTAHVVNAALENGVRLFVFTSSIAALGGMREGKPFIDEDNNPDTITSLAPYGRSKFLSENEVRRGEAEGMQCVIVNPALIFGVGDWTRGSSLIISVVAEGISVYTDGVIGCVDARDVAQAEVALAECEAAYGERFVLSSENCSIRDLLNMGTQFAGLKKPWFRLRPWMINAALKVVNRFNLMRNGKSQLSQTLVDSVIYKSYYDGSKVQRYIAGFEYRPLKETLEEVIAEYKKYKTGN